MQGSQNRASGMTMMNARSSRSHAVFALTLEQQRQPPADTDGTVATVDGQPASQKGSASGEANPTDMSYLCAKMLLVDLAGSERAKRTQTSGARMQEGIHINQGAALVALSIKCIDKGIRSVRQILRILHNYVCSVFFFGRSSSAFSGGQHQHRPRPCSQTPCS